MLVENNDGSLGYIPDHLVELLAEAEENEIRGTFWYTCPNCRFTTNKIHEVYQHKVDNCQNKNGCQVCGDVNPDIDHYIWHGYESLQDGVQTMRAKLRPRRSTPYKPPQRRFVKEEEKKEAVKASSGKEPSTAGASSSE